MQNLDMDVHRRKWALNIQGVKGAAGETEDDTRKTCVDLARDHLGIRDAKPEAFRPVTALSQQPDAAIIIRFRDLMQRNRWLTGARRLKGKDLPISISPDLPPKLRQLKRDILDQRRKLSDADKRNAHVRY